MDLSDVSIIRFNTIYQIDRSIKYLEQLHCRANQESKRELENSIYALYKVRRILRNIQD